MPRPTPVEAFFWCDPVRIRGRLHIEQIRGSLYALIATIERKAERRMLIREQGRLIKLQRGERSVTTGRNRRVTIGAFRFDRELPTELLEQLSGDERKAVNLWFAEYRRGLERAQGHALLRKVPSQLDAVVAALDVAADNLSANEADALWHKLQAIACGLRRGGHPRPKRPVPRPVAAPGQLDLVDSFDGVDAGHDSL